MMPSNVYLKLEMVLSTWEEGGKQLYTVPSMKYHGIQYMSVAGSFIESNIEVSETHINRHYDIFVMLGAQDAIRFKEIDNAIRDSGMVIPRIKEAYGEMCKALLELGMRAYAVPLAQVGITVDLNRTTIDGVDADANVAYVNLGVTRGSITENTRILIPNLRLAIFSILVTEDCEGSFYKDICNALKVEAPKIVSIEDESPTLEELLDDVGMDDEDDLDEEPSKDKADKL